MPKASGFGCVMLRRRVLSSLLCGLLPLSLSGLILPLGSLVRMAFSRISSASLSSSELIKLSPVGGRRDMEPPRTSCGPLQKPLLRSPLPSLRHAGGEYPPAETASKSSVAASLGSADEWRSDIGLAGGSKSCKEASRPSR